MEDFLIQGYFFANSGLNNTTASAPIKPFLVPPNEKISTPALLVKSAIETPRLAAALLILAPSKCRYELFL